MYKDIKQFFAEHTSQGAGEAVDIGGVTYIAIKYSRRKHDCHHCAFNNNCYGNVTNFRSCGALGLIKNRVVYERLDDTIGDL